MIAEHNRLLDNWQEEKNSAALYVILAEHETNPHLAEVYRRLAEAEEKHATLWGEKLL
ncbi:MAG TPA: rubrerythrin family protein, partial [Firmicutes bacterium]|nr:rubrerythrin family protein [Bacillota bacterium]